MRIVLFLTLLAAVFFVSMSLTFGQTVPPAAPNAFEAERQEILKDQKRALQFIGDDTEYILDSVRSLPDYMRGMRSDLEDWRNGWMNSQLLLFQYYGVMDADGNVIEGSVPGSSAVTNQLLSAVIFLLSFLSGCVVVRIFTGSIKM